MHGKKGNLGIQKFRDSGITENKDSPVGAAFSRDSNTSYDLNGFQRFQRLSVSRLPLIIYDLTI